jgi:uncharacterized protein (TIGR03089 family)
MTDTIPAAFSAAVAQDPAAPLLTWYDDASGDRTELSGATLTNWVAKTANLLADGSGVSLGDPVAVILPPHWQTAAILLGSWSLGAAVTLAGDPSPAEVLFASEPLSWPAGDRYLTGLLPLAAPLRSVPAGYVDYTVAVRGFGDHFAPAQSVAPDSTAVAAPVSLSHLALSRTATARAAELGIVAGDRVLIDLALYPDPTDWLLAPLFAGASTVLCANLNPAAVAARSTSEKVTVQLT